MISVIRLLVRCLPGMLLQVLSGPSLATDASYVLTSVPSSAAADGSFIWTTLPSGANQRAPVVAMTTQPGFSTTVPQRSAVDDVIATTSSPRLRPTPRPTGSTQHQMTSATVHIKFNCQRPWTSCAENSSCPANGTGLCACADGQEGYDCSLPTRSVVPACDPPCRNGGLCYSRPDSNNPTSSSYFCYCTEAYHGDSCEKERVNHKCNPNSMEISIAPIVGSRDKFGGAIYVMGYEEDEHCVFDQDHYDSTTYHKTLHFDACGQADNHTDAEGVTSLSWRIVVRYEDVLLDTDQELMFTCYLRQSGSVYDWHAWVIAQDNLNANLPSRTIATDVQPVHMALLTASGRPVEGPQPLGTSLMLKYTLNGGDVYDSFTVDKVAVSNSLTGTKRHVVTLVSGGCVTEDAVHVKKIVQSMEHLDAATLMLHFKVFKLRFSSHLVFENVIKACHNSADCRPPVCDGAHLTRMKRHSNDATNSTTTPSGRGWSAIGANQTMVIKDTNASLTVWYPADSTVVSNKSESSRRQNASMLTGNDAKDSCMRDIIFVSVVVSFVVFVVIFAAVSVICVQRFHKL